MFDKDGPTLLELARQALSSTDRGYDLLAPKFDRTPFRTPDVLLERTAELARTSTPPARVLDVCCGTGAGVRWFRSLATEEIVGVDRSQGMLDEAKRRLVDAPGRAPITLVQGDALAMPFDAASFDLACCFGAFGHILEADEPTFVRELHRVLRPGGRFVFITSELPPLTSPTLWAARGFNAVMRIRNALIKPEFIMYYLTFLLPGVSLLLRGVGFEVRVIDRAFEAPFSAAKVVIATKSNPEPAS